MDRERFLELLAADGARLRVLAARDLDAVVPTCEGWTVRDAVEHVIEVYEHKVVAIGLGGARPDWPPADRPPREPLDWFDDAFARLLATLRASDPAAPSWTWWPEDQTAGFWVRRMAQETAVHRVDVESAFGEVTPVAADLALDGIDEVLELMLAGDWSDEPQPELTGTVAVVADGRCRVVTMTADDVVVTRDGAAATTVAGAPSDLLLWLWGRAGDDAVTVSGDAGVAARLRRRLALATR